MTQTFQSLNVEGCRLILWSVCLCQIDCVMTGVVSFIFLFLTSITVSVHKWCFLFFFHLSSLMISIHKWYLFSSLFCVPSILHELCPFICLPSNLYKSNRLFLVIIHFHVIGLQLRHLLIRTKCLTSNLLWPTEINVFLLSTVAFIIKI